MTNDNEQKKDAWKVMIVDDEPDVHNMTRFVLGDFTYQDKGLKFLSAYSGKEAMRLIEENPDTALILLDVVMEQQDSGLMLVKYIRETLNNENVRIVLRTGQPGVAPQRETVKNFKINGYNEKNGMSDDDLYTTMVSSIRTYTEKSELDNKLQLQHVALKEAIKRGDAANIAKAAFLSTISHELRTPLTSISGFLEILEERFKKTLIPNLINIQDKEIREAIDFALEEIGIISSESETLSSLVNELIELSNINSDSMRWKRERIDISSVFDNIALIVKPLADKKGLYIKSEIKDGSVYIIGDIAKITQVVRCLFDNAIKFTLNGGITYSVKEDASMALCTVSDTGNAIPSDKLEAIFEKFIQLSDVLTSKSKGSGLGLSITKEIIKLHDGCIRAESKEGVGNSFIFILPVII
jgi:signal transduction histidine kinase